ncbi:MAG: DUF4912 domain-containing protein [Myxococcaceae bacterium]
MDDLKSLTVRYLRELARKHLGKGYSRLKTKDELIAALKKAVPSALKPAAKAAKSKTVAKPVVSMPAKIVRFAKQAIDRSIEVTVPGKRKPPPPAEEPRKVPEVKRPAPKPAAQAAAPTPPRRAAPAPRPAPEPVPEPAPEVEPPAPPLVEGFFVARVAGEGEVRRHHLTEEQARPVVQPADGGYDEKLGELPDAYEDDSAVLLPRDPNTLFFFWDFQSATRAAARSGLNEPRAVIRVYEGEALVREVDFALESKSFYVHDLPAGRPYRVEAHFVGKDGQSRRVGRPTNVVALPSFGPSQVTSVRFLRIPWTMPLRLLRQYLRDGRAKIEQLLGEPEYVPVVGFAPPGSHPWTLGAGPRSSRPPEQEGLGWVPPVSGRPY